MNGQDMKELAGFLHGTTKAMDAAEDVIVPAPIPEETTIVAVAEPPVDKVDVLKAKMMAIGWLAKDLHYRAKDRSFYGNHLLADLIYYVTDKSDKLNEVYYLGEKMMPPPCACETAQKALGMLSSGLMVKDSDEMVVARRLLLFLESGIREVERIKDSEQNLKAGTVAVLDSISEELLKDSGLLRRMVAPVDGLDDEPVDGTVIVTATEEANPIDAYLAMTEGE